MKAKIGLSMVLMLGINWLRVDQSVLIRSMVEPVAFGVVRFQLATTESSRSR